MNYEDQQPSASCGDAQKSGWLQNAGRSPNIVGSDTHSEANSFQLLPRMMSDLAPKRIPWIDPPDRQRSLDETSRASSYYSEGLADHKTSSKISQTQHGSVGLTYKHTLRQSASLESGEHLSRMITHSGPTASKDNFASLSFNESVNHSQTGPIVVSHSGISELDFAGTIPRTISPVLNVLPLNMAGGDMSKANSQGETSFDWRFRKLQDVRNRVFVLRSSIQQARSTLREKQELKSISEDRLIQRIRLDQLHIDPSQVSPSLGKSISDLIQDCQDARDEYGPLEYECNQLEDELSKAEFEMNKQELELSTLWTVVPISQHQTTNDSDEQDHVSLVVEYEEEDDLFRYHPLVIKYLSREGDLGNLNEQLDEMEEEREDLQELKVSREIGGLRLAPEDQEEWDGYEDSKKELLAKIEKARAELKILKKECFAMQLLDDEDNPLDFDGHEWKKLHAGAGDNFDSGSERSVYSKYPELLSSPDLVNNHTRLKDISQVKGEMTDMPLVPLTRTSLERIGKPPGVIERSNSWLLENLRTSAVEVNHLVRISTKKDYDMGISWQLAVLSFWNIDQERDTRRMTFTIYSSTLATDAAHMSTQLPTPPKATSPTFGPRGSRSERPARRRNSNASSDITEIADVFGITKMPKISLSFEEF